MISETTARANDAFAEYAALSRAARADARLANDPKHTALRREAFARFEAAFLAKEPA